VTTFVLRGRARKEGKDRLYSKFTDFNCYRKISTQAIRTEREKGEQDLWADVLGVEETRESDPYRLVGSRAFLPGSAHADREKYQKGGEGKKNPKIKIIEKN